MVAGKEQQQIKTNKGMTMTCTEIMNQKKHEGQLFCGFPKSSIVLSGALISDQIFRITSTTLVHYVPALTNGFFSLSGCLGQLTGTSNNLGRPIPLPIGGGPFKARVKLRMDLELANRCHINDTNSTTCTTYPFATEG